MRTFEPVFAIRGLMKRREGAGTTFELRVPELVVRAGDVLVLRGVSGSGKSTLLDILAMALRPDHLERFVFSAGGSGPVDVAALWRSGDLDALGSLRARRVGYVLQTGELLSFLTARENITLPCRLLGKPAASHVERLAERLDIAGQLEKWPAQLSVGERQRVAIARALAHRPSVVLADEPTASLDPINASGIMGLFLELVEQLGITAVIATHDWRPGTEAGFTVANQRLERAGQVTQSFFWS